jgi:short-subunit dehydrogenase
MVIDGKVVLITGASQGIGAACASAFGKRGARLSLTARSEERLRAVAGSGALVTAADITDAGARRGVIERTVDYFGSIDILVNNAGMGLYTPAWEADPSDCRQLFELNLFAPLALTQLAVPHMRRQKRGMIVNVGSIAGKMTLPWLTLYSVSKYGLGSLTDGLRMELRADGIHAMLVCPGYVHTDFQKHALGARPPEKILKGKRFAISAEQCAAAIVRGVERNARTIVTPRSGWLIIALARLLPSVLESQLAAIHHEV